MSAEIIEDIKFLYGNMDTIDISGRKARELIDYVEALKQELAEARKDTERRDWLERLHPWPVFHDGRWINYRGLEDYATLGEAIDAARGTP